MCSRWLLCVVVTASLAIGAKGEIPRVAIAVLRSENIKGNVLFTKTDDGLHVTGSITGLQTGLYGFHIHESGDITTCVTTGGHFDTEGNYTIRHVGEFGNIVFDCDADDTPTAIIDLYDKIVSSSHLRQNSGSSRGQGPFGNGA